MDLTLTMTHMLVRSETFILAMCHCFHGYHWCYECSGQSNIRIERSAFSKVINHTGLVFKSPGNDFNSLTISWKAPSPKGMYEFSRTGQLLPILIGTTMEDIAGTGTQIMPLGGTMEHPEGTELVPITIGVNAADPVTAELSPVIGVRTNPETGVVIPVTVASGGHKQRKAPLGALAMLQEETVAHKSHWRRVRQKEAELMELERKLANQILFNFASVVNELADMEKRETQRRKDAEEEYTNVLPPDVTAILTEVDPAEHNHSITHNSSHRSFSEVIDKFLAKMIAEDSKYRDSMAELEGAMNPDAESVATKRHKQSKGRQHAEVCGQIWTRLEAISLNNAHVEFFREIAEILAKEAKDLLTGNGFVAGSYDCMIGGIYGELNLTSTSSDQELVPLLKQLIAMLESGSQFVLSSDLLSGISGQHLHLHAGQTGHTVKSTVQSASKTTGVTLHKAASKQTVSMQKSSATATAAGSQSLEDTSKVKDKLESTAVINTTLLRKGAQSSLSERDQLDMRRQLFEKQAYEASKLESHLRKQEIDDINSVLEKTADRKTTAINETKETLAKKLAQVTTADEADKLILSHAKELKRVQDKLEAQKLEQLSRLQDQLINRRRKQKKDLHKLHIEEAKSLGVSVDNIPTIVIPAYEELDKDLKLLALQQQKMLADMKNQLAEQEAQESGKHFETDASERLTNLHLSIGDEASDAIIKGEHVHMVDNVERTQAIIEKLRSRRQKKRAALQPDKVLSAEDNSALQEVYETQENADFVEADQALLAVMRDTQKSKLYSYEETELKKVAGKDLQERDRLIEEHKRHLKEMERKSESEINAQKDRLAAKLAARKRMQEELSKEKAVNEEMARLSLAQARKGEAVAADAVKDLAEKMSKTSDKAAHLHEKQTEKLAEVEVKVTEELRAAVTELDKELESTTQVVEKQMSLQKQLALESEKGKFDREMAAKQRTLSTEEYERLLAEHKKDLAALENNLDTEKARQQKTLQDKIEERKRQRAAQLKAKLDNELSNEMVKQQQERDSLLDAESKKQERDVLQLHAAGKNGDEKESLIFQVLRQRHLKQAVRLEDQQTRQSDNTLAQAENGARVSREEERAELIKVQEQELTDLIVNAASLTDSQLAEKRDSLKRQHKKQLSEFDGLTLDITAAAKFDASRDLEIKQTYEKLHLKEEQLKELFDAMKDLTPEMALTKQYEEEAEKARAAADKYKVDVVAKMAAQLEESKAAKLAQEEAKRKEMEEAIRKMEEEFELEKKKEEEREAARLADRQRLQEQQLRERQQKEEEEIANSAKDEDERAKLLAEHKETVKKLQENLESEKEKSHASLQAKLEARRERRAAAEKARIAKDLQQKADEQRKQELQHRNLNADDLANTTKVNFLDVEGAETKQAALRPTTAAPVKMSQVGSEQPAAKTSAVATVGPVSEKDYISMLMSSPLFQQVEELQSMLDKQSGVTSSHVTGGDYSVPYLDVKDAQWKCEGELVPVDIRDITASQFVIYRFGVFVAKLMEELTGVQPVSILLASKLPHNNYTRNAYRHSFYFERARNILFVRKERLESIGEFILVIVHCLSHIAMGDLTDDAQPMFLRAFYKALKVVCQDMFFSRSRPSAPTMTARLTNRSSLELAFKHSHTSAFKTDVLAELIELRVGPPERFDSKNIDTRLKLQSSDAENVKLRHLLNERGGTKPSLDIVEQRLAELKGLDISANIKRSDVSSKAAKKDSDVELRQSHLLSKQLERLENISDDLNTQLLQVLEKESQFDDKESDVAKTLSKKKSSIAKSAKDVQTEIQRKRRELKGSSKK
ncbi:myosin-2 heavy chain-like [Watersipora subatra]|uniref:myosin-2 heavy chain-like n=1 Tax=Watersipora subatra TaxID=2589382 RepID=UPI00355C470C